MYLVGQVYFDARIVKQTDCGGFITDSTSDKPVYQSFEDIDLKTFSINRIKVFTII